MRPEQPHYPPRPMYQRPSPDAPPTPADAADSQWAGLLSHEELRQQIIEQGARIALNDGRLSADSSADLDLAQDLLDAALREYVRRAQTAAPTVPAPLDHQGAIDEALAVIDHTYPEERP
jgi:hypothetical protein